MFGLILPSKASVSSTFPSGYSPRRLSCNFFTLSAPGILPSAFFSLLVTVSLLFINSGCFKKDYPGAAQACMVSGRIIDSSGTGVAFAQLSVADITVTTDKNGYFTQLDLPAGKHSIVISLEGRILKEIEVKITGGGYLDIGEITVNT